MATSKQNKVLGISEFLMELAGGLEGCYVNLQVPPDVRPFNGCHSLVMSTYVPWAASLMCYSNLQVLFLAMDPSACAPISGV